MARAPKANPDRDLAFAEIADWLLVTGTRFWISSSHIATKIDPLERFTARVSRLKTALNLAQSTPSWSATSSHFTARCADLGSARFGTMKVAQKQIHMHGGPWQTDANNINPPMATPNCSTYGQSNCSRQDGRIIDASA